MTNLLNNLGILGTLAAGGGEAAGVPAAVAGPKWVALIPLLALLGSALCFGTVAMKVKSKLPAWISVALLGVGAVVAIAGLAGWWSAGMAPQSIHVYDWLRFTATNGGEFIARFGFYMDGLSWLWMLFVMVLGTLIALYSSEYMADDVGRGYGRYFGAFCLFVFSMACLVMGDNLVLLYLGWEGVGLCSYLLIGYFYKKPAAVAAAKKAFIINRIGDLGLALGIFLTYVKFGTVEYAPLFQMISQGIDGSGNAIAGQWTAWAIPLLFTAGAFGKSAQLFFYVWLPDAMEGPTPVSALIHAATMVTAGVYLIARMYPLFTADPDKVALTVVAWSGAITAFWAATIEMAIFDIKRVMGYSTVSQLGYMFAGLGLLSSTGAVFHVFTHAFFKATLFLCCGAVMHGFGGQLDLRKLSGVMYMKGFRLVGIATLLGSINLAGVPFTAGYFSKDMILAQAFSTPSTTIAGSNWIGWLLLLTACMTAYYTFRTFFRVFLGPKLFEPGDEAHGHHGDDHAHGHDAHGHANEHGGVTGHGAGSVADRRLAGRKDFDPTTEEFDPHPPGWAMNLVLVIVMVLTIVVAGTYFVHKDHHGWVGLMVHHSTAAFEAPGSHHGAGAADGAHAGPSFLGYDPHKAMYYVSAALGALGILIAYLLHLKGRTTAATANADKLIPLLGPVVNWARNKWYVDELYDAVIVKPLWVLSHIFHIIDKLFVDGLVNGFGALPRAIARQLRPSQGGVLQSYAVGMAGGLGVILLIVWVMSR